jgi:hypothetical protein
MLVYVVKESRVLSPESPYQAIARGRNSGYATLVSVIDVRPAGDRFVMMGQHSRAQPLAVILQAWWSWRKR